MLRMVDNRVRGFFLVLIVSFCVHGQTRPEALSGQALFAKLEQLDAALFQAVNTCDLEGFKKYFTEDLEFYHDIEGLMETLQLQVDMFKNRCSNEGYVFRRELVTGSLEVYPLNKYGAIQSGEHRFYETIGGGKEKLAGRAKFTHVWKQDGGTWRISRVLSYDHKATE